MADIRFSLAADRGPHGDRIIMMIQVIDQPGPPLQAFSQIKIGLASVLIGLQQSYQCLVLPLCQDVWQSLQDFIVPIVYGLHSELVLVGSVSYIDQPQTCSHHRDFNIQFGFYGDNSTGAPREITPQPGDTFTVLEKWLDLDQSGSVAQTVMQEGKTLTFGA